MGDFFQNLTRYLPYVYFIAISLVAMAVTIYDKIAAKKRPQGRVPEIRLFIISLLGGSVFMYATMLMIRHKTKHKRFMIGLPLMIAVQFALLIWLLTVI